MLQAVLAQTQLLLEQFAQDSWWQFVSTVGVRAGRLGVGTVGVSKSLAQWC